MTYDLVVRNGRVVTAEDGQFDADVAADGGTIAAIGAPGSLSGERTIDATGKYVLPGVIDPHTHHGIARDLAADAESESRSGLVGGVTTIGNFFRRPDRYRDVLPDYFARVESSYYHDYFFSLGLLSFEHVAEIPTIVEEFGITSFKWYSIYRHRAREVFGVDCDMLDDFADAFVRQLSGLDVPTTLGFHAENTEITSTRTARLEEEEADGYHALLEAFPDYAETQSLLAGAGLARQHGYDDSFYAVHVSAGRTADELAALQAQGWNVTGETCPHYLALTADECDPMMKINPPIRGATDRDRLWERLADGTLSTVGSDHCCKPTDSKHGETIWDVANAFPGSATLLPLVLSEGVHRGRISLERAVAVTSTNTAKAWNLYPKKGSIRVGSDADLAVVDLDETKTVTPELLQGGVDYTIYDGREVTGWPTHTVVRGTVVYEDGEVVGEPGHGERIELPV